MEKKPLEEGSTKGLEVELGRDVRRKVLDLLNVDRKVVEIAVVLGVSEDTVHAWRRQLLIDNRNQLSPLSEITAAAQRSPSRPSGWVGFFTA